MRSIPTPDYETEKRDIAEPLISEDTILFFLFSASIVVRVVVDSRYAIPGWL